MVRRSPERKRLLVTVLFTDIVDSTKRAAELGDGAWRRLQATHHSIMRKALKRHRGREIDTAGDGFFATFEQPSDAITCAEEMVTRLRGVGIDIRAGVHMGEVEASGPNVSGIAVHIGARVMSKAGAGEVYVSSTVRDLMTGSDRTFEDVGVHQLKGVDAQMHLFAIRPSTAEDEAPSFPEEPEAPRRSTPLIVGALGAAAALAVVVFLALNRSGDEPFIPAPNTVAQLDAGTGEVVGGVRVGTTPTALAYGGGRLWVANFDDKTIQSVDVATATAAAAKGGVLANPTGIAVGGGFVWVTNGFAGQLVKLDPSQPNAVVPIEVGSGVQGVAFGFDRVWIAAANEGVLLRLDPATDAIERVVLGPEADPLDVAVGGGFVWVTDGQGARVLAVDPQSLTVERTVPLLRGHPSRVAFGAGSVWVTSADANSVTRIDPASGQATTVEDVGNGALGVAASDAAVWVANSRDGTVSRIDPSSAEIVSRVELGFSPDDVEITANGVWVSLHTL